VNPLTLKGFLRITLIVCVLVWLVGGLILAAAKSLTFEACFSVGVGGAMIGWMVPGSIYVILVAREICKLEFPSGELRPAEEVLMVLPGRGALMRYFWPIPFRIAVGGKLFLTNQRILFAPHRGQPGSQPLSVELEEIANAEPFSYMGFISGALRVITRSGHEEQFTFGFVQGEPFASDWAEMILWTRDRTHLDPTSPEAKVPPRWAAAKYPTAIQKGSTTSSQLRGPTP
jgi:hypothetical protein